MKSHPIKQPPSLDRQYFARLIIHIHKRHMYLHSHVFIHTHLYKTVHTYYTYYGSFVSQVLGLFPTKGGFRKEQSNWGVREDGPPYNGLL